MKYISLDLETTCLEPDPRNVLMVSMVFEDTENIKPLEELSHLTFFVNNGPSIIGSPCEYNITANVFVSQANYMGSTPVVRSVPMKGLFPEVTSYE